MRILERNGKNMKFERVCESFNVFLAQSRFIEKLFPAAMPLMLLCAALRLLGIFVPLGGVVNAVIYFGFFCMLLLVLSLCDFKMAAVGLLLYALAYLCSFLKSLFAYHSISWGVIIYFGVFLYLACLSFRKSMQAEK